jgi:hypothetical protein
MAGVPTWVIQPAGRSRSQGRLPGNTATDVAVIGYQGKGIAGIHEGLHDRIACWGEKLGFERATA